MVTQCIGAQCTDGVDGSPLESAITSPSKPGLLVDSIIVGSYVIVGYEGKRNDWHYVNISKNNDGRYTWTNRAGQNQTLSQSSSISGVAWSLTYTEKTSKTISLAVSATCPYYASGHTTATVFVGLAGQTTQIGGPWGERYAKQ